MERLWSAAGPTLVRDVVEDLQRERKIAYTTVMTVMDNLFRKGLLTREKVGRAYAYSPVRSRAEHAAELMEAVLSSTADRGTALLHFVEHLSESEIADLRSALSSLDGPLSDSPEGAA